MWRKSYSIKKDGSDIRKADFMHRKLPIGIQDFEKIRKEDFIYVDKTEHIYRLAQSGAPCFLSRPRRFGKSLLLSTMRCFFEGQKELFEGLEITSLMEKDAEEWRAYPVFYFDFNKKNFMRETALEEVLDDHLRGWEKEYGMESSGLPLEERFQHLIVRASERTGLGAVVLVDEYDKPLLETMADEALEEHNRAVFKGFFSTLKSYDRYLRFVFLTGVTKFSKVSIFSDLNHLRDISMNADYAGICGITEEEIRANFLPETERMAHDREMGTGECLQRLKQMYDGYHFHHSSTGMYNPFSLLNALSEREFGYYWFESGTPTFLIGKMKEADFDAKRITEGNLYVDERSLMDYRADNPNPLPLFYQTGYLTIGGYDKKYQTYALTYPNDEVKYGFLESLAPLYLHNEKKTYPLDVRSFGRDMESANTDGLKDRFAELFARLPYTTDERPVEQNFQNVVYITFMLLGQFVHTEVHNAKGRADCIVETDRYVYIFEFKRDRSAQEALAQIEEKGYALSYAADERQLIKAGVNFDSRTREIDGWEVSR